MKHTTGKYKGGGFEAEAFSNTAPSSADTADDWVWEREREREREREGEGERRAGEGRGEGQARG